MKKFWCVVLVLALAALCGCGKRQAEEPAASQSVQSPPSSEYRELPSGLPELEGLTVELPRSAADGAVLLKAVKALPEELERALASQGVESGGVRITMGSSPTATLQAVTEGSVDIAVLPVMELAAMEEQGNVLLLSGAEEEGAVGERMLLCIADTEYGRNLAGRKEPTWKEVDRARWGLVKDDLFAHYAVELWLADRYQGNGVEDLESVTWFEDRSALLEGVRKGEVDVFPATAGDLAGAEYPRLGTTERLYTMAVVVKEELMTSTFAAALSAALGEVQQGEYGALFGKDPYAQALPEALDAQRRIAFLMS